MSRSICSDSINNCTNNDGTNNNDNDNNTNQDSVDKFTNKDKSKNSRNAFNFLDTSHNNNDDDGEENAVVEDVNANTVREEETGAEAEGYVVVAHEDAIGHDADADADTNADDANADVDVQPPAAENGASDENNTSGDVVGAGEGDAGGEEDGDLNAGTQSAEVDTAADTGADAEADGEASNNDPATVQHDDTSMGAEETGDNNSNEKNNSYFYSQGNESVISLNTGFAPNDAIEIIDDENNTNSNSSQVFDNPTGTVTVTSAEEVSSLRSIAVTYPAEDVAMSDAPAAGDEWTEKKDKDGSSTASDGAAPLVDVGPDSDADNV